MKILILFSVLTFSQVAFSCTDFTGEYQDAMTDTFLEVTQKGCSEITYSFDENTFTSIIDGKERLVGKYTIENGDLVEIYQSSKFNEEDKLITKGKSVITHEDGSKEVNTSWSETFLHSENDMATISHLEDGTNEVSVKIRIQ